MESAPELESKFDLPDDFRLPALDQVLGGGQSAEEPSHLQLQAAYYDSTDLRLLRAGITLRRREGGEDEGWHLKLPLGGPERRLELRLPLGRGTSGDREVPSELAELVVARLRGAPLQPVLQLSTERTVIRVVDAEGRWLLEVADDRVVAERPGGETSSWRELEVERAEDAGQLAAELARHLREAGARPAPWPSKAARALAPPALADPDAAAGAGAGAPGAARRKGRGGDLLALRLQGQLELLSERDLDLRRELPESVHDLRVAVRRLRSALRTCAPLLEVAPTAGLQAELGWLGDLLGGARDAEVLAGRAERGLDDLDPTERLGPVRAELVQRLQSRAVAAREALLEGMREPRYGQLLVELERYALAPPYRPGAAGRAGRLRRCTRKELRRVRRRVRAATGLPPGPPRDLAFHEARKVAKRVRYAAETLAPAHPSAAPRLAAAFEALQELLGERHDAAVAHELLAREGARAGVRPGENGYTYGVLAEREHRVLVEVDARFAAAWRRASRRSLRRFLG